MWLRLRQIALIARELPPIVEEMHEVFGLEVDFQSGGEAADGPWEPAGKNWKQAVRTEVVKGIAAAEIQSPEPEQLAKRWSEILELPIGRDSGPPSLRLENASIRFVKDSD